MEIFAPGVGEFSVLIGGGGGVVEVGSSLHEI